jgi:hypothetical protein
MSTPLRLVAPFLPVKVENHHHQEMSDFDWMDAIRMLSRSAELSCGVPVQTITDVDTDLPVPTLKYPTRHRRLMLWTLEAIVRYVESSDFDRDTVVLDCDQLIHQDLRQFFSSNVDLGLLVRATPKHAHTWKKVLNGVQFLSVRGKKRMGQFYREALTRAEQMNDGLVAWGADTAAIRDMVEPVSLGVHTRCGARVSLIEYSRVLEALSEDAIQGILRGEAPRLSRAVTDFRFRRKRYMRQVYEMSVLKAVPA